MTDQELLAAIDRLRSTMVAVATGGPRIDDVNWQFGEDFDVVDAEMRRRGVLNPFPYRDLWQWHGKWSTDLVGYASRRSFVAELTGPAISAVKQFQTSAREPTGWLRVDRAIDEARHALSRATVEEQFQSVGLMCREALISCAQEVHEPFKHPILDDVRASQTDFKRLIEAYIAVELRGSAADEARKYARSALDLAVRLQHQRTATSRDAAICIEASASVIGVIAIVSGLRSKP